MSSTRLFVLAALLLSAATASADGTDNFRALMRLPNWTQKFGMNWTSDGKVYLFVDTPLAREELAAARKNARKNPDDHEAQNKLYKLLNQTGNRVEAAAVLRKTLTLCQAEVAKHPKKWEAHAALAYALAGTGDHRAAEAAARRAVTLAPEESDVWRVLAMLLQDTHPSEAMRAMDKAVALAEEDDVDTRLMQAFLRIDNQQRRFGQFPAATDAAVQGAVVAQMQRSLRDTDKLLLQVAQRLKAADGTCGPDTRDRCLVLMTTRDMVRAKLQASGTAGRSEDESDIVFTARTAKLIQEIIPSTSDDLARLFMAAFLLRLSVPDARAAADPYLRRLDELAKDKSPVRAATAIFLHGVEREMMKDYKAAESYYRRATELVPSFDVAWLGLGKAMYESNQFREAACSALLGIVCQAEKVHTLILVREWSAKSGSLRARYALAQAQAEVGNWSAAQRTIADELKKYPDDPRLMLARAACWLRSVKAQEDFNVAYREVNAAYARIKDPTVGTSELRKECLRIEVILYAVARDVATGRRLLTEYAQYAKDEEDRKDVMILRELLYASDYNLPETPESAARRAGALYRLFDDAKVKKPTSADASQKITHSKDHQ